MHDWGELEGYWVGIKNIDYRISGRHRGGRPALHEGRLLGVDKFLTRCLDGRVHRVHGRNAAATGQRLGGLKEHHVIPLALRLRRLPAANKVILNNQIWNFLYDIIPCLHYSHEMDGPGICLVGHRQSSRQIPDGRLVSLSTTNTYKCN